KQIKEVFQYTWELIIQNKLGYRLRVLLKILNLVKNINLWLPIILFLFRRNPDTKQQDSFMVIK
ncbi:hypothetical protein pb186bvf_019215, partial [Paramecium bursaria]